MIGISEYDVGYQMIVRMSDGFFATIPFFDENAHILITEGTQCRKPFPLQRIQIPLFGFGDIEDMLYMALWDDQEVVGMIWGRRIRQECARILDHDSLAAPTERAIGKRIQVFYIFHITYLS